MFDPAAIFHFYILPALFEHQLFILVVSSPGKTITCKNDTQQVSH